jgi:hypothetical protein
MCVTRQTFRSSLAAQEGQLAKSPIDPSAEISHGAHQHRHGASLGKVVADKLLPQSMSWVWHFASRGRATMSALPLETDVRPATLMTRS